MPKTNKERLQDNNIELTNIKNGINNLPTYLDTNDATALSSEIVDGKSAYVKGKKIYGTLNFNVEQVVAGVDEIKKIYEKVPNDVDVSSGSHSMTFEANSITVTDNCSYTDPNFSHILTFINENGKTVIKVYSKASFELEQTLNVRDDLGLTSNINYYDRCALGFVYNGVEYIFAGTGNSDTRPSALYKMENGEFVFKDSNCMRLLATPVAYSYAVPGYIYPGYSRGYCFHIESDKLVLKSLSNWSVSNYSNPWTASMFCRDNYVIFANYYGSQYKSSIHKVDLSNPIYASAKIEKVRYC